MAINLHEKYASKIAETYTAESFLKGRISDQYSFVGVRTVKVSTPVTVPMNNYQRTGANRYGNPTEMGDVVQELTMTQDRSFSLTIDKGNNMDQNGIKPAGKMLKLQIKEQAVPEMDRYGFGRLAQLAGTIVGNSTALAKNAIVERITMGTTALDDAEVPQDGRTLFITAAGYAQLRLSPEFLGVDKLAEKSLAKGQVGEYDGMTVVKVPKGRWPENVNFMIVHKNAATNPVKISDAKIHTDPPGISGNLLEGREYYDLFVLAARANGVYVEVDTSANKGTVLAAPTISTAGAITGANGATFHYTTDGSDPRYSTTAKVGTTSDVTTAGTIVKAYATKAGAFPSPVAVQTLVSAGS